MTADGRAAGERLVQLTRPLVVVGMMAAGKTTFGRALAAELEVAYLDSDDTIERSTGVTGRALAADAGVESLHDLESAVLVRQIETGHAAVISAAASVIDVPSIRDLLARRAIVVWLDVEVDVIWTRLNRGDHRRPMRHSELVRLAAVREPLFSAVADIRVAGGTPLAERVAAVVAALGASPSDQQ